MGQTAVFLSSPGCSFPWGGGCFPLYPSVWDLNPVTSTCLHSTSFGTPLPLLTGVSPHVALEVESIVKSLATAAAHVTSGRAVALEMPRQHALQWKGLGAEWTAKGPRAPRSEDQSALHGLWEGHRS